MAFFTTDDLLFTDYNWHSKEEKDDPRLIHFPDEMYLDLSEGYEVLGFINSVARMNRWKNKESGYKLERLLKANMPPRLTRRNEAYRWVTSNWSKFP